MADQQTRLLQNGDMVGVLPTQQSLMMRILLGKARKKQMQLSWMNVIVRTTLETKVLGPCHPVRLLTASNNMQGTL